MGNQTVGMGGDTSRRLVPAIVARKMAGRAHGGTSDCAVLALDIVGFTRLAESFRHEGPAGTERLARILSTVYGRIDKAVAAMGGEVSSISGDGLLAIFPGDGGERACCAAGMIRGALAEGADGISVQVRIGVARGTVALDLFQTADRAAFGLSGDPVVRAWQAEGAAQAGWISVDEGIARDVPGNYIAGNTPGFLRLVQARDVAPKPSQADLVGLSEAQLAAFVPPELSHRSLPGEFRDVVSAFVRFPDDVSDAETHALVETILTCRNDWGGLGCKLDHTADGCSMFLFWGAPNAHEHDIQRALHSLKAIQKAAPFPVSIGACHGPNFVGFLGAGTFQDYTCVGASTNLAARIAARAPSGAFWVDATLAKRLGGLADTEPADRFAPKGFIPEQTAFAVLDAKTRRAQLYGSRAFGREQAEAVIREKIEGLVGGEAWGLILEGEPGIGKSHLSDQIAAGAPPGVRVLRAQTDPIARPSLGPCWTLLGQLVDDAAALQALADGTALRGAAEALERAGPQLAEGLGLDWPDAPSPSLDAAVRLRLTQDGLVAALRSASETVPLLIHLEDIHWLDTDSRAVIARLLIRASAPDGGSSLGVMMTARPRLEHLPDEAGAEVLEIERLDGESIGRLVAALLQGPISSRLHALVNDRSAGVPLYATQLARFLLDESLVHSVSGVWHLADAFEERQLPGDARGLLLSRIDRLPEAAREVLAIASVLGGVVDAGMIGDMVALADQRHEDPAEALIGAETAGILIKVAEGGWMFSHALLRDAAYELQLTARRQHLHQTAAAMFEARGAGAAVLANHCDRGGLTKKAIDYHRMAGKAASDAFQNEAAAWHLGRALALLPEADAPGRFDLALALDEVFSRVSDHLRQGRNFALLDDLAEQLGDAHRLKVAIARLRYHSDRGDYASSIALLDSHMDLAEHFPGTELAVQFYTLSAHALIYYQHENRRDESIVLTQKATRHARELGDREHLAQALLHEGLPHRYYDDSAAAALFQQSLATTEDPVLQATILHRLGSIAFRQDEIDAGHGYYDEALALARETGDLDRIGRLEWGLAIEAERRGDIAEAEARCKAAFATAREINDKMLLTEAWKALTHLAEAGGRLTEADAYYDQIFVSEMEQQAEGRVEQMLHWIDLLRGDVESYLSSLPTAIDWAVRMNFGKDELATRVEQSAYSLLLGRTDMFEANVERIEFLLSHGDALDGWGQFASDPEYARIQVPRHAINHAIAHYLAGDLENAWAAANDVAQAVSASGNTAAVLDFGISGNSMGTIEYAMAHYILSELDHPAAPAVLRDAIRRLDDLADRYEAAGYPRDSLWKEVAFRYYLVQASTAADARSLPEVLSDYRNAPASTKA